MRDCLSRRQHGRVCFLPSYFKIVLISAETLDNVRIRFKRLFGLDIVNLAIQPC